MATEPDPESLQETTQDPLPLDYEHLRAFYRHHLLRWQSLIETPTGFPDNPPIAECWIWTGTATSTTRTPRTYMRRGADDTPLRPVHLTTTPSPRAKWMGQSVHPARILNGYILRWPPENVPPMHREGRGTCTNDMCVNPNHFRYPSLKPRAKPRPRFTQPLKFFETP